MGASAGTQQQTVAETERLEVEQHGEEVPAVNFFDECDAISKDAGNDEIISSKTLLTGLSGTGPEAPEKPIPPVLKAKSAPVLLLPAKAVPNRREMAAQRAAQPQEPEKPRLPCASVRFEDDDGEGSTCVPAKLRANSPSTANSASRRRRRRSVTFGEAEVKHFVANVA